jgi:uncharacterized lipoprotein YmbA
MKTLVNVAAALGVGAWLLAGCGSLSAKPDPSRFFTLSALSQAEESAGTRPPASPGISLGVGPITLPGYLDRQEIVIRVAPNQIDLSENDRWAEPLEENFSRVLSQNIAAILRADRINAYPWPIDKRPVYQVEVEVLRFEANTAQEAQLSARWTVRHSGKKDSIRYRETRLSRPAKARSTDAAVAALSEVVGDFSREIAEAIESMDGKGK